MEIYDGTFEKVKEVYTIRVNGELIFQENQIREETVTAQKQFMDKPLAVP